LAVTSKVTLEISAGFPVPDTVRVTAVMFTVELLGFVNTICWTVTPVDPGSVVALLGGLDPWESLTMTTVGVPLGVLDAVAVVVIVAVNTKVLVALAVGLLVVVRVGVEVGVEVVVRVGVKESVDVAEFVRVSVTVAVLIKV